MRWSPDALRSLERAIEEGRRVSIMRRGTDFTVEPEGLRTEGSREILYGRLPSTGETLDFPLDEIDEYDDLRS